MEPSDATFHLQVYATLAYGGRGIQYFTYYSPHNGNYRLGAIDQFGNKTATWDALRRINLEIHALAPALLRHPLLDPRMTPDVALTFFIIIFGFFSLRQPVIFREPERQHGGGEDQSEKKYEKSGLKSSDADRYLLQLKDFMETEKPYLDPDLTIIDLSERLKIPRHHLTQVINERMDKNFYLFVNEYRIREAREIMTDPEFSGHTILRIAYESGFNSKSVFNSIFKKITSHTPTEYRFAYGPK